MDIDTLEKLALKFNKLAQQLSAQPSDIQQILQKADMWSISPKVSPLLNAAGVPEDASVSLTIVVGSDLSVNFIASLNPENPKVSKYLAGLLKQKYSGIMTKILKSSNIQVSGSISVKWLSF